MTSIKDMSPAEIADVIKLMSDDQKDQFFALLSPDDYPADLPPASWDTPPSAAPERERPAFDVESWVVALNTDADPNAAQDIAGALGGGMTARNNLRLAFLIYGALIAEGVISVDFTDEGVKGELIWASHLQSIVMRIAMLLTMYTE